MQVSFEHPQWVNGQLADGRPVSSLSKLNELVAQQDDIGGTTFVDGEYTVTINSEEGTFPITFTASGAANLDAIMAGLAADADANDELLNVAEVTANGPVLEIRYIHEGRGYTYNLASPNSDLTVTQVQAPGGTDIPLARVVVRGAKDGSVRLPSAASVDADAVGIVYRGANLLNRDTAAKNTIDRYIPGEVMDVLEAGSVIVETETAWADGGNVFFRIQNADANVGEAIGKVRNNADGGDAVQLIRCKFEGSGDGPGLAKVVMHRP